MRRDIVDFVPSITTAMVRPSRRVRAVLRVPGDKSISHRYAILAALADGASLIHGFAPGHDCRSTLQCLRALGVHVADEGGAVRVTGRGLGGLAPATGALDAGNSGTTMRLLAGVLGAHPFVSTLTGDRSLSRRPMRRVIDPLVRMGAAIDSVDGHAPLTIAGAPLRGITFESDRPSAQVKSAVLLAGLHAKSSTTVVERTATRDHTELALRAFGATVTARAGSITIEPQRPLRGLDLSVPGDLSSAAFWLVAAAGVPGGDVSVEQVGLNPTRTAFLDLLRRAGADVAIDPCGTQAGEPVGAIRVRHREVRPLVIAPSEVAAAIDELPALAALAAFGGEVRVSGAAELRVKESDRIAALVAGFRALGAEAEEQGDGFHVSGRAPWTWRGGEPDAAGDHRLAMTFAVAALGAAGPSAIRNADSVAVSYPGFFDVLASLDP